MVCSDPLIYEYRYTQKDAQSAFGSLNSGGSLAIGAEARLASTDLFGLLELISEALDRVASMASTKSEVSK